MFLEHTTRGVPGHVLGWAEDEELSLELWDARGTARMEWESWESYHGNPVQFDGRLRRGKLEGVLDNSIHCEERDKSECSQR